MSKKLLTNLLKVNLILGLLNLLLSALVYLGKQDSDLGLTLLRFAITAWLLCWICYFGIRFFSGKIKEK